MIQNTNLFQVPNSNSNDAKARAIYYEINKDLFDKCKNKIFNEEYLCICGGGTTSSCVRNNHITVDLRKQFNQIIFNQKKDTIKIGGGVSMGNLIKKLDEFDRTFPIGLSTLPGIGYILTGGIGPLSRRYGLAIDNMISAKGFLGNGEYFSINSENIKENDEINIWEGIKGAAPFFSIITEIGLKTFKNHPILVFQGFVNSNELIELITKSEEFPDNMSLQWIFSDNIYVYIVTEIQTEKDKHISDKYLIELNKYKSLKIEYFRSLNNIRYFPKELKLFELNPTYHSEVISILGMELRNNSKEFINELKKINSNKPNKSCYVASQQLGGKTKYNNNNSSFFVHRECSWKPWIYAAWEKDNLDERKLALSWMNNSWNKLKRFFPYIHLAQLHNHLNSHKEEINLAFGDKLSDLKLLKKFYDPSCILPPL